MLLNGFSVYLFRITKGSEKHCYVGMTGDNHYPSARSAVHRFSGHFELQKTSTQNQLARKLSQKGDAWIAQSTIELFHWPIEGYEQWEGSFNEQYKNGLTDQEQQLHDAYKMIQREVLELEKYVISELSQQLSDNQLWNKKISSSTGCPKQYQSIASEIIGKALES